MNISRCMSADVKICSPKDSIRQAARTMLEIDAGSLPVGENDRLVGMITDRDIAVRAVAEGLSSDTPVGDVMTKEIHYCLDEDDVEEVAERMGELKVRRMAVINRDKRLVGVVSLGDLSRADGDAARETLAEVSEPGGPHRQH